MKITFHFNTPPMKTIFLFIICSFLTGSCSFIKLMKHKRNEELSIHNKFEKFGLAKNLVIIPSAFPGGEQRDMALDLGAASTVLLKNSGLQTIDTLSPVLAFGISLSADHQKMKNKYYAIGTIKTNAFELNKAFLTLLPDFQVSPCNRIVGVWGSDLFDEKILVLNMEDSTLAVFDTLPSLDTWTPVESEYKYPLFYIILGIGNQKVKLLLDTGFTSGIVLSQKTYHKGIYGNNQLITDAGKWMGKFFNTASGLSDADTTLRATLVKASWGSFSIDSIPLTVGNQIKRNIAGMELFKRFNLLLDYQHGKIFVQPNPNYKKPASKNFFVEMGFSISNSKDHIITVGVIKIDSPAEKAGIKTGDQVISISDIKSETGNNCEVIKLLNALDCTVANKEVVVKRADEVLKFVL